MSGATRRLVPKRGLVALAAAASWAVTAHKPSWSAPSASSSGGNQSSKPNKVFTREEVKSSPRRLTIYRGEVFDITDFAQIHPGGDEIHRCFGASVDKYFHLFPHHEKPEVLEVLDEYRVGKLIADDNCGDVTEDERPDFEPTRFVVPITVQLPRSQRGGGDSGISAWEEGGGGTRSAYLRLSELPKLYPTTTLRAGIACGLNGRWVGRWEDELRHRGGHKQYSGVWLGDVLAKTFGVDVTDRRLVDSLYVHYRCYDDYVDSLPLGECLRRKETSLLVLQVDGQTLRTDRPYNGGGPLMALTVGTHHAYPCDAKWITGIAVDDRRGNARHGGKYGDQFA